MIPLIALLGVSFSVFPAAGAMMTAPSAYSFSIACHGHGSAAIGGGGSAIWNWTVNGVKEDGGQTECGIAINHVTGTGTVPSNANGIVAQLSGERGNCAFGPVSTTQSFAPGGNVNVKLSGSCSGVAEGQGVSISVSFSLKS